MTAAANSPPIRQPSSSARFLLQDEQLAVIPVLHEERDMLREALSEERASREEDLHNKDGEIATLKAKVRNAQKGETPLACLIAPCVPPVSLRNGFNQAGFLL